MNLIKQGSAGLIAALFLVTGCASRPVISRPTRKTLSAPQEKSTPAKIQSSDITIAPQPLPAKNISMTTDSKPHEPNSLISELKKNISNEKFANELIENKLSAAELESVAADNFFAELKPQVLLKLGKIYQKNRQPEKATEYFRSIAALYPQSPYSAQATVLLSTIQLANDVDAKVIGAILPLTGKNASLGQHALNAIRMGLDLSRADNKFRLALFDSQSNPELAAAGVDKLVKEDKAIVLLGGFTAREAGGIANRAELLSTPYIGFSQKSGLTSIGEYIFRNSVTPEMQVDKLVQFAVEKLSAKKFAILFPNDSYGVGFSNIFWDHILARGGEVTAAQTYDPKETDFSESIQKLVGTYYVEARLDEYNDRVREIKEMRTTDKASQKVPSKKSSREHLSKENVLSPIVDFDVLFVPDSSRALGQIMAFMKYNDIKDMKYLGTNIWNSPDLPKRTANQSAKIYFVDAVDVSQGADQPTAFFKEYFALYNEEPTLVEIQTYEVAKIVREQITSGATSRESLANSLRSMGRRSGVTGELRMSSQREIERPIYVLTLDSGLLKKVE